MFTKAKNIDTAFRQARNFFILVVAALLLLCLFCAYKCFKLVEAAGQKVYVLANGKAMEAVAMGRKDNIPVEARDHIGTFHGYFFTLSPDDKLIQANIIRALYLADESAKQQYDNLKEGNYYSSVVSGNVSQTVQADSIAVNTDTYPYYWRFYGKQEITRSTTIVIRSLVTEGYLRSISRSDNNPHGFLIERWKVIENKDINIKNR